MLRRHKVETTQYTIRNVPKVVDRALRRRAERLRKSLNEVAVEALARGAGVEAEAKEHHDLEALAEQRTVDRDLWK
jgi:hypothetical protein